MRIAYQTSYRLLPFVCAVHCGGKDCPRKTQKTPKPRLPSWKSKTLQPQQKTETNET